MKEIMCGYRIAGKLPKGDFKRLTACVVDFDKDVAWMLLIRECRRYRKYLIR
jgi:hypothetical protein